MPEPNVSAGQTVLRGTFLGSTEKAIKFQINTVDGVELDGVQRIYWLPLSQVDSDWQSKVEGEDWVIITNWLARKVGLI